MASQLNQDYNLEIDIHILDARKTKQSASKMKKEDIKIYNNIEY